MSDASTEVEKAQMAEKRDDATETNVFARRSVMPLVLRAGLLGATAIAGMEGSYASTPRVISDSVSDQLSAIEERQADLFAKVVPSVTFISTEYTSMAQQLNLPVDQMPKGVGTGFVWDKKGHIVTNFHVINKVDNAMVGVTQPDGTQKQYKAKLTGVDPDRDIAVLKIDAPESDLAVLAVGDSTKTRVGQFSFAVGNPFGQDHSLSTGVISGKNRVITAPTGRQIKGVLQTDAAINPGNSGGPLLDSKGKVIGINTASLGAGVSAGVGFAVPIELALPSINQLIEFGQVQRAIMGISYLERLPTQEEAARGGLPFVEKGIVVLDVPKGSPGDAAGMIAVQKPADPKAPGARPTIGDIIVGVNKDEIKDPLDLTTVLNKYMPGTTVDVQVLRGKALEPKTLKLKLGAFETGSFSKMENERGTEFAAKGTPLNVPLGEIAPAITPKMETAPGVMPGLGGDAPGLGGGAPQKSPKRETAPGVMPGFGAPQK